MPGIFGLAGEVNKKKDKFKNRSRGMMKVDTRNVGPRYWPEDRKRITDERKRTVLFGKSGKSNIGPSEEVINRSLSRRRK